MDYLDFELRIGAGSGREYPVRIVRSPGGEQQATMQFPFDELALKNRLQAVKIALLKSGGTHRDLVSTEKADVEQFGKALFDALLVDKVHSCYRVSKEKARQQGKGLRFRLRVEAPELAALPWEFLFDESESDYVCLSSETPIIRYLELDRPPQPIKIKPPLRILAMIASPKDLQSLDIEREKQRMNEALRDLTTAGLVELTWLQGQTWQELQKALLADTWHVFHFVGHGGFDSNDGEGLIALADEQGKTFRLSATKLGRLLADHKSLRLVLLNACSGAEASETDIFSSTASVLIRRGIPAVVAMQFEITDRAAIQFARTFYESIANGVPVDTAVTEARKAISMSVTNTVEWGTPVLHMRSPDGLLFQVDAQAARKPPPEDHAAKARPQKISNYRWPLMVVGLVAVLFVLYSKFKPGTVELSFLEGMTASAAQDSLRKLGYQTGMRDSLIFDDGMLDKVLQWNLAEGSDTVKLTVGAFPEPLKYALKFDGVDDYVNVVSKVKSLRDFTIECWVNLDTIKNKDYMAIWNFVGMRGWHLQFYDNALQFHAYYSIENTSKGAGGEGHSTRYFKDFFKKDTWYHLAIAVDSNNKNASLFVNGEPQEPIIKYKFMDTSTISLHEINWIGAWKNYGDSPIKRKFKGQIGDIRVWKTVRTPKQIKDNMYKLIDEPYSDLYLYFPIGEYGEGEGKPSQIRSRIGASRGVLMPGTDDSKNKWIGPNSVIKH